MRDHQLRKPALRSITAASIVVLGMVACTAGNSEQFRQAPNYASPLDVDAWRVECFGLNRREIIVMESRTSTFYKEDGTLKTRDEFCEENRSVSRIN